MIACPWKVCPVSVIEVVPHSLFPYPEFKNQNQVVLTIFIEIFRANIDRHCLRTHFTKPHRVRIHSV